MSTASHATAASSAVRKWLWCVALLVFAMVLVGGATRLTDSGLSITEWRPLDGIWPPLTAADWDALFAKYKLTSEFAQQNSAMTLDEFKPIFWWEYGHRLLGRFIGVAFVLPFLGFFVFKRISKALLSRLLVILALGAAQGGLGWFMVRSGLVDRVDVSQYRLAAHLSLAALIFALLVWTALGAAEKRNRLKGWDSWLALVLVALMFLQIAAGGFVAGLDAGQGYNTWPKMDGQYVPDGLLIMEPVWRNFFENAMMVQFQHRALAYITLVLVVIHAWQSCTLSSLGLLYVIVVQVAMGILTVVFMVPLAMALGHQAGAMIALTMAVANLHRQMRETPGLPAPQTALMAA